jgi:hypothetical protein
MAYLLKSGEKSGSGTGFSVPSDSPAPASGSQSCSRLKFEMKRVLATSTSNSPLSSRYCFIMTVDFGQTAWLFCPSTMRALSFSAAAAGSMAGSKCVEGTGPCSSDFKSEGGKIVPVD